MSKIGRPVVTEGTSVLPRGWWAGEWGVTANGYWVCFWGDENILELDRDNDCPS